MPLQFMDLFAGKKPYKFSNALCAEVALMLERGEGVKLNHIVTDDGDGNRMYIHTEDGLTHWEMSTASGSAVVGKVKLRNHSAGTYSSVMRLLMTKVPVEGARLIVANVQDPGTIAWLREHGFVQEVSSDDYVYMP